MKAQVRVIARPEVAAGFALAGIPVVEAEDPAAALARLVDAANDPGVGVLLVEEATHRAIPDPLRRELARRPLPIIVPFPPPTWEAEPVPDRYIVELLRQVIGYRVRLR